MTTNRSWYVAAINRVDDHIDAHLAEPLDLETLAAVAHFSPWHFHRGQTPLDWRVATTTLELGAGTITWPRDLNDDAEAYATELLEVAEKSFTPGCPSAAPPPALAAQLDKLSAHRLDTDATSLNQAASSLDRSWRDLLREPCARR